MDELFPGFLLRLDLIRNLSGNNRGSEESKKVIRPVFVERTRRMGLLDAARILGALAEAQHLPIHDRLVRRLEVVETGWTVAAAQQCENEGSADENTPHAPETAHLATFLLLTVGGGLVVYGTQSAKPPRANCGPNGDIETTWSGPLPPNEFQELPPGIQNLSATQVGDGLATFVVVNNLGLK